MHATAGWAAWDPEWAAADTVAAVDTAEVVADTAAVAAAVKRRFQYNAATSRQGR